MKPFIRTLLIACFMSGLCVTGQVQAAERQSDEREKRVNEVLDLAVVGIQNPATRAFFKSGEIRVRKPGSTYMPKGALPILKVESPSEQQCRERLAHILNIHGGRKPGRVKTLGGALTARLKDVSCWIHPASGGYKLTATKDVMTKPTGLKNFKEAVQLSLDHIAKHKLVELTEGEEIDIRVVSSVHNALSDVQSPEKPLEQFVSDHYVSFGRRFRGVPIVGSHFTVRVDGEGNVVMINRNWRRLVGIGDRVRITQKPVRELVFNSPEFRKTFGSQKVRPEDINIAQISAGYVEAPFDRVQKSLRPGCLVSFWVGKIRDEMDSQLVLSLEEQGSPEQLLGERSK